MNERKLKIQRKKPRKSSACGKSAIRRLIFRAYFHFVRSDPRPPNFAEIHARGRRGRLEYDHRDLIPPWGHGLLHSEAEKPTTPVCFDRNGGALPSRQTGTVDKGNDGCAGHGRHTENCIRSVLRHIRSIRRSATGTGPQNCQTLRAARARMCACMQLLWATFPPNQGFIRAFPGEKQAAPRQNRTFLRVRGRR